VNIDDSFRTRLSETFRPLNRISASGALPPAATLTNFFAVTFRKGMLSHALIPKQASHFGTAAVEIWQRSVHSFLISASLTNASPIWASVSGYYSSHYSVRGIAHLLGYFYLFKRQTVARLEPGPRGGYTCSFMGKPKNIPSGEHQIYWGLVKRDSIFAADPLFTENKPDVDESDAGHRNFANYIDHIYRYPIFHPLDENAMKTRVDHISKIEIEDPRDPDPPPIPRKDRFPDVERVQLIAYHRLVSFRKILDEVLADSNRFWNVHRNPSFATGFMNFQLAERSGFA